MSDEQQRQASLIILPPIILGYDELTEQKENSNKKQKLYHHISHEMLDRHHVSSEDEHIVVHKKHTKCNGQPNYRPQVRPCARNVESKPCNHG